MRGLTIDPVQYPDYDPRVATTPLDERELDELDTLLAQLPAEAAMNAEAMDGYLTALLVGPWPRVPPSARWMPVVWGGDGEGHAPFASGKQRKRVVVLLLRHLHALDRVLRESPDDWEPVLSVAEQGEAEIVDAEDWCAGFLAAVPLDPDGWAPLFEGPTLAPLVRLGAEDGDAPADAAERDELSRAAVEAVLALAQARPAR